MKIILMCRIIGEIKKTDDEKWIKGEGRYRRWENKWENPLWDEGEAKEDVKAGDKWRNICVKHRRCWV